MNKTRRHKARKRRHWARVKRELHVWSMCNYRDTPKGGRLRRPVLGLDAFLRSGLESFNRAMAPFAAWIDAHTKRPS